MTTTNFAGSGDMGEGSPPPPPVPGPKGPANWRDPLYKRLWYGALVRGYLSKPFLFLAGAGFYAAFVQEKRYQVGSIVAYRHDWSFSSLAVGLMLIVVFGFVGLLVRAAETGAVQRARDRKAAEIMEAVLAHAGPRYLLYLRPFFLTRRMNLKNPKHGSFPTMVTYYSEGKKLDFETMLERAARKLGPLLALGQPGEMIGAGRLAVDDEHWKARFEALALSADCIFVIPSNTTGCTWEIAWLREHAFLSKVVFIMPPQLDKKINIERCWKQTEAALAGSGIHLPVYHRSGLLFTLHATGSVAAIREIGDGAQLRVKLAEMHAMIGGDTRTIDQASAHAS